MAYRVLPLTPLTASQERKQARMRSLLLRMMNGLMHTAWRKWREHVLMEHVARERRHTTLARKQTMSFQKERAIDKLVVTWKKMRLRRFVRAMNLWKAFVVEAQRNQDAIRAHGSLMRRCIRRLTNGRVRRQRRRKPHAVSRAGGGQRLT